MMTDRIWATAVDESITSGTFVSMVDYPEAPNRDARPYLLATPAREAADGLLAAFEVLTDPEAGEIDRRLAIKDARSALAKARGAA